MARGFHVSSGKLVDDDGQPLASASAAIVDLTHSALGGTANDTLQDCTASYSEAAVEANFKDLATKVNQILAALRAVNIVR